MTVRRITGWVAALVAVAYFALSAGWYAQTRSDDSLAYAKARDTVLATAREELARLNTVDASSVDEGLRQWLDATTGPLRDQLQRTGAADGATLSQAGTSARGTVTDAAVTELDTRAGTARLIATVQVTVSRGTAAPSTDRKRFEAALARTPGGWKVTALTAVPVGAS
ncbi:hypothetical protein [Kitasatospora sp. MAP5-34]|uniref:hypothetical protein n=1 Tax=Kitasatospora sp. MAP5-34 TaxID=3035102 RepID=UPI0024744780|nr:hypothetical protein [Kitasatospora sp. MAP5-34]MDH6577245.1 Mce-associated membrane protein [Kitasatospora sp. MAP5-34]